MDASKQIDKQIADIGGWQGEVYSKLRKLIHEADPNITEDFKWGTGVFVYNGNICAVGSFKDYIKLNFFQGALISDPKKLFNAGLEAKKSRGIDLFEGDEIDMSGIKQLITSVVKLNKK